MSDLHLGAFGQHQKRRTYKLHLRLKLHIILRNSFYQFHPSALESRESTGMNYRVVLSVLFVTLSWRFIHTSAQNNTAVNPNTVGGTAVGSNATITGALGGGNATIIAITGALGGGNATNAGGSNATNVGGGNATNAGGGNATNAGGSNTTVTLAGSSTTAAATTTTAVPVVPLVTTITGTGCGSTKLCAAQPSACDPSTGNQCYFISAKQQSGQLYNFELSGQSDGYIAAALSTSTDQAANHQAYICANNNGVVNFLTGNLNSYNVTLTPLTVSNVTGTVNSGKIQCTFGATLPDTKTRAAGFSMSVSTGSLTNGKPGQPFFRIITPVVNLSDPNSTTTNLINSTNSTNGAYPVAHQQSLMMPALLLTVTILGFTTQ